MARPPVIGVLLMLGVGCSDRTGNTLHDVGNDGIVDDGAAGSDDSDGSDATDGSDDAEPDEDPELDPPPLRSFVVEPTPTYGPVQGAWPAAAFDGTQYLAVWEDHRLRRPILYGGRITADGTALDPFGFRILDAVPQVVGDHVWGGHSYEPDVAFDGENFLAVTQAGGSILGVRVSPGGEVLDPGGFIIADPTFVSRPSLLFDGERYLVAWSQTELGTKGIFQARVEPNGTVLDPGGAFVYESHVDYDDSYDPCVSISFDGSNTLLSWMYDENWKFGEPLVLYAGRASVDGTPIDEAPFRISPQDESVEAHAAGFDGTNYVLAWSSSAGGIRASRITSGGTILDPDGFVVENVGDYQFIHRMDIAAANGHSLLAWSRFDVEGSEWPDRTRAAWIATDGTTSLHPDDAFPRGLEAAVVMHPEGGVLLRRDGVIHSFLDHAPIVGTRLDVAGLPLGDTVAPTSPASRQDVKAAASDAQNFLVLWTDTRDASGRALYGARIGADGTPLDESFQLTDDAVRWADVVFDGANFVVTWLDPPEYGDGDSCASTNTVRISPAGERLDVNPLKTSLCGHLAMASDGTHTLLVGEADGGWGVGALLLDQAGAVASEIVSIPDLSHRVAASFDGSGYLMVWVTVDQLLGHRITQAGALEGQPFVIVDTQVHNVSIAAGGGSQLLVADTNSGIWATRMSPDGQLLDPEWLPVSMQSNGPCWEPDWDLCAESSVVFDGENFVIAWRQLSNPGDANSLDLYAALVSPQGAVSPSFPISQAPEREGAPFLAFGGGELLAAYNRFMTGPPYDTRRAVGTLLP